ncbi:MAG: cation:proton antiporter [Actinomycetota bacterium]|nr:cation:proton antiporter [Actinomycetota bacterium]
MPDLHVTTYLVLGIALLGMAALPNVLDRGPLALPVVYVAVGAAAFALLPALPELRPTSNAATAHALEYAAEVVVLVSLAGVGLRLDRRFGWRSWSVVWRLLGIAMPLTIAAVAGLGVVALGLPLATAVLLGAVLAPTDPVLAGAVQVDGPGEGREDEVRFSLTTEAGLNDGLAFPFTYLALALVAGVDASGWADWVAVDLVYRIVAGLTVGAAVGMAVAWYVFRVSDEARDVRAPGLIVIAVITLAYGLAELAHGYGFLAVFTAAVAGRRLAPDAEYHRVTFGFNEQVEQMLTALSLICLGGIMVSEADLFGWRTLALAVALVLVVRPLAGRVALLGARLSGGEERATAFFGVRGVGSIYYLAFAQTRGAFDGAEDVWAVVLLAIAISAVVHGVTAGPAMARLDRLRART